MLDENGKVIEEGPDPKPKLTGDQRTWRVLLDSNQYQLDMSKTTRGGEVGAQEVGGKAGRKYSEFIQSCNSFPNCGQSLPRISSHVIE